MLEFFSTVEGLTESFPIINAKDYIPKWSTQAKEDFKNQEDKTAPHVALCPGIFDIMKTGYIINAWCDFEIYADENGLQSRYPPEMEDLLGKKVIQIQSGDGIAKLLPKKPWANKDIVKINTPWYIKSNKKFLMIPLPYNDNFSLESSIGILDPSISNVINIQSYVNGRGILSVKAGEPLCQLIPLTEEVEKLIVRDANKKDLEFIQKNKFINNNSFRLNRQLFKNFYKKFISPKCPFH